jgi:uncharacterized protein YcaQ
LEARRFLLAHQGLYGKPRFAGSEGVMEYVRQAGCVQFDPVDVCGRSPELVFLARVKGYQSGMLQSLLYEKRDLLDYFDKNLAIIQASDWPYFQRARARYGLAGRSFERIEGVREEVLSLIRENGPLTSSGLGLKEKVDWYWSQATLGRAALEGLYFAGELVIHHKAGTIKAYDLAENCLPGELLSAPEPLPDEMDHLCWLALRRIRAVGLMWNRASDAWLGIPGFKSDTRSRVFQRLMAEGRILPLKVEGVEDTLFMAAEDEEALQRSLSAAQEAPRCAFIAPLDSLIWDRKLIDALFSFRYTWELYTPPGKRVYGSYVLPILYGDRFLGRLEPVCDRGGKVMRLRGLWWEEDVRPGRKMKEAVREALSRLAALNGCIAEERL